jgi:hypothetical protein
MMYGIRFFVYKGVGGMSCPQVQLSLCGGCESQDSTRQNEKNGNIK